MVKKAATGRNNKKNKRKVRGSSPSHEDSRIDPNENDEKASLVDEMFQFSDFGYPGEVSGNK